MTTVSASELALGDVVRLFDDAYGDATVQQVTDEEAHLFRPYVHTSDFSSTSGVITYVGHEIVKVWREGSRTFNLIQKGGPLL